METCKENLHLRSDGKYLGHIVSEEGVKTDAENIVQFRSWPLPKKFKELRLF